MSQRCLPILLLVLSLSFHGLSQVPVAPTSNAPPTTPARPVADTYFGTKIIDNFRWIEDLKNPEVQSWFKAQNDYTRSVLDRIPGRDRLRARIAELDDAGVRVSGWQSFSGRLFYLK